MNRRLSREDSKDELSIQNVDFFEIFNEIQPLIKNKKEAEELFYKILNHENYSTNTQSYEVISNYIKKKLKSSNSPLDSNTAIFHNYIKLFKQTSSPSTYQQFLFFIQLYSIGRISHATFVNLILNLLSSDPELKQKGSLPDLPHIKLLPSFMSTFNNPSLSQVGTWKGNLIEDYCSEIIVGLTSYAANCPVDDKNNLNLGKVALKCLQCLGMGLINIDIAKFWLSKYFPQEYFAKLDKIPDYSLIIPSQRPHEMIGCTSDDNINDNKQTAAQMYIQNEIQKCSMLSLYPVATEVYEKKLQLISRIFDKICYRETIEPFELAPFFGEKKSPGIINRIEKATAANEINILAQKFDEIKEELTYYLNQYLSNTIKSFNSNIFLKESDNPNYKKVQETTIYANYRYIYNAYLRHLNFCRVYEIPGTRKITFGSIHRASVAVAFVHKFIKIYFSQERYKMLLRALSGLMPLFDFKNNTNIPKDQNKIKIIKGNRSLSSYQIAVLAYLSEIARTLGAKKDVDKIQIKFQSFPENEYINSIPYFDENQNNENIFIKKLMLIPLSYKKKIKSDFLSSISENESNPNYSLYEERAFAYKIQSIDMVLTLLVQQLYRSAKKEEFSLLNSASLFKRKRIVPVVRERAFDNDDASIVISSISTLFSF